MSASLEQSQKELQLKQERLQQLIQLQQKQDEYIKLVALKNGKQKVPAHSTNQNGPTQEQNQSYIQIDDVDQQPTPKTP